jgi:hypothetical protein
MNRTNNSWGSGIINDLLRTILSNSIHVDISGNNRTTQNEVNNSSEISIEALERIITGYTRNMNLYNRNMEILLNLIRNNVLRTTTSVIDIGTFNIQNPFYQPSSRILTSQEIDSFTETIVYNSNTSNNEVRCPISLEDFHIGEQILRIKNCRHIFKSTNLRSWLSRHTECPVCRRSIIIENTQIPLSNEESDNILNSVEIESDYDSDYIE